MEMKSFGHYLPEELITQILLNLPVKALVRFKSVCKSWNSIITDPKFVNDHLRTNNKKSNASFSSSSSKASLVFGWIRRDSSQNNYYPDEEEEETDDYVPEIGHRQVVSLATIYNDDSYCCSSSCSSSCSIKLLSSSIEEIYLPLRQKLIGEDHDFLMPLLGSHCNGILCLVNFSLLTVQRVVFYNPALREHKFVQTPSPAEGYLFSGFGFGHDTKADDYKFVAILKHDESGISKANVYTLGTNSWREVEVYICCCVREYGVYHQGFCYWVLRSCNKMLSFGLSYEKFSRVVLPGRQDPNMALSNQRLVVWNELLVCFVNCAVFEDWGLSSLEMWVMSRGDSGVFWTKHRTIRSFEFIGSKMAFWKEDELLMEARDGRVFSYNVCTNNLRKLAIQGTVLFGTSFASLFIESLVSVKTRK